MQSTQSLPALSRPLTADDIDEILQLEKLSFDPDAFEGRDVYLSRLQQFAEGCIVLEDSGHLVGFFTSELWSVAEFSEELFELWPEDICCHHSDGHSLYISSIAVHPDYRNRGLASVLLLQGVQAILRQHEQIRQVFLTVAESWLPARRLYLRNGFQEQLHLREFFGGRALEYHDGILMTAEREIFFRSRG